MIILLIMSFLVRFSLGSFVDLDTDAGAALADLTDLVDALRAPVLDFRLDYCVSGHGGTIIVSRAMAAGDEVLRRLFLAEDDASEESEARRSTVREGILGKQKGTWRHCSVWSLVLSWRLTDSPSYVVKMMEVFKAAGGDVNHLRRLGSLAMSHNLCFSGGSTKVEVQS